MGGADFDLGHLQVQMSRSVPDAWTGRMGGVFALLFTALAHGSQASQRHGLSPIWSALSGLLLHA